jgi:hypothetical protein
MYMCVKAMYNRVVVPIESFAPRLSRG